LWSVSLKSNYQICYWFWNFIWFVVVFPKYYGTSSGFYRYIIVFVIVFRKIIVLHPVFRYILWFVWFFVSRDQLFISRYAKPWEINSCLLPEVLHDGW
jgi:hypothetical protein